MFQHPLKRTMILVQALIVAALMVGSASAQTFDLCAGEAAMTMPDGQSVTVWGFGMDTGGACTPTVPGPTLRVDPADSSLVINLRNTLTEPVSLHILGQQLTNNQGPVWDGGIVGARPNDTARVRSFSHEAPAGGSAQYQWNNLRPGTFLLQSGTNPAKQVQMGLIAPVVKDAATGVAYADNPDIAGDQSVSYNQELILVFHEIDPAIHAAVAAGTYGPGGTITSSIYRDAQYFLINGMVYPDMGLRPINSAVPVNAGDRLLLRVINGGLETHVPQMLNGYMSQVAVDGNPLSYAKEGYAFELTAATTVDVVYEAASGRIPFLDGRLKMSNAGASPGGMVAFVDVGGGVGDTVSVTNAIYDSGGQTLTVIATSSDQPNVDLNAEGYGPLDWKSWKNFYRSTFSNVPSQPGSILVTSSGGGSDTYVFPTPDTVSIDAVVYDGVAQTLTVVGTSSDQPNVSLTAEGYGALEWKSWKNFYRQTFTGVASRPASVTVNSSGGGTDTYIFPAADTVTITALVYDGIAQTLTVVATSSDQPNVSLTAEGYGALEWKSWKNFYRNTFTGVLSKPLNVTVNSTGGGSDTQPVP